MPISQDLQQECLQFMASKGFNLDQEFIPDGSIHRFSKDGLRNKVDEWYVAHEGISSKENCYLTCTFGSWKTDEEYKFKSWDNGIQFGKEEQKEFEKTCEANTKKLKETLEFKHDEAAKEAERIWRESSQEPPSEEYLSYLKTKKIDLVGARYCLNSKGYPAFIIPFYNIKTQIRTLQIISFNEKSKTSFKSFLFGGEKKGNFAVVTNNYNWGDNAFYVCEGYATGVSIFMSQPVLNIPVIVAGDAGNISPVIENLRSYFPDNKIIIAADSDEKGITKAKEAASKYNCKVVLPKFPKEKILDVNGKKYTNFNDLHCALGLEEVNRQLNTASKSIDVSNNAKKKDVGPCYDFSLNDYPELISKYVSSICLTTSAEPVMVLSSVLSMISAKMGKRFYLSGIDRDYFQDLYPNIWILMIAKSGQFKSTALNKGAKIALKQSCEISKEIKVLQRELNLVPEVDQKNEIKDAIEVLFSQNPMLPTKVTAEALLEGLSQGRGGLILSNELSAWLQNLEKKYNNDLKAILTDFFDVPGSFEYKTKTQGDMIIEKPFISICGVSPLMGVKVNLNLNDVASGFFARFLIITPPYNKNIPPALPNKDASFDLEAERKLEAHLLSLLDLEDDSVRYVLSSEAEILFNKIHEMIYKNKEKYDEKCQEILEPFVKRWSPYVLKIAMIMQCVEDNSTTTIGVSAIKSAWKFVFIAMRSTGDLYEGELGESITQRKCRMLYEFVKNKHQKTNSPVLRQTIFSSKRLDGKGKDYDNVLDLLIDQGKLEVDTTPKKKNQWKYTPKD